MDDLQNHYAKWKELDTQDHVACDCIHMKCPGKDILQTQKVDQGLVAWGSEWEQELTIPGHYESC